jgi:hypothetical protein
MGGAMEAVKRAKIMKERPQKVWLHSELPGMQGGG